nr:hypothetical protein GCM10020093_001420 [Planobispora longispora]
MIDYSRRTAATCLRTGGDLIRHLSTANAARDLDRIRAALGEGTISLYGISYGTYLGAVYATLFPHRTGRVVLDSAVDPHRVWYDFIRLGGRGVAERLPDLTAWVAARHDAYGFGRTPAEVRQRYRSLTAGLDADPVEHSGVRIDGNMLRQMTLGALKTAEAHGFPQIAAAWAYLAALAQGRAAAAATPPVPAPHRLHPRTTGSPWRPPFTATTPSGPATPAFTPRPYAPIADVIPTTPAARPTSAPAPSGPPRSNRPCASPATDPATSWWSRTAVIPPPLDRRPGHAQRLRQARRSAHRRCRRARGGRLQRMRHRDRAALPGPRRPRAAAHRPRCPAAGSAR